MKIKGKRILLLMVAVAFVLGTQSFLGCDLAGSKSDDSLLGYWKSSYGDGFELYYENLQLKYKQYDDATKTVSFAGIVVNNPDLTASTGYIIIQITDTGTWGITVGNYYAVHWKDFTGDTVKQAAAYKVGGDKNNGVPTAEEAATEYTVTNGYYTYYGNYQRQ